MIYMETLQVYTVTHMGVLLWVIKWRHNVTEIFNHVSNVFPYRKVPKSSNLLRFEKKNGAGKNCIVSFIRFTLMGYNLINARTTEKQNLS